MADDKLKPVEVELGITDGIHTEVTKGIEEGAVVVTGIVAPQGAIATPGASPFGGSSSGSRRGM
jgi:hypothetical protein